MSSVASPHLSQAVILRAGESRRMLWSTETCQRTRQGGLPTSCFLHCHLPPPGSLCPAADAAEADSRLAHQRLPLQRSKTLLLLELCCKTPLLQLPAPLGAAQEQAPAQARAHIPAPALPPQGQPRWGPNLPSQASSSQLLAGRGGARRVAGAADTSCFNCISKHSAIMAGRGGGGAEQWGAKGAASQGKPSAVSPGRGTPLPAPLRQAPPAPPVLPPGLCSGFPWELNSEACSWRPAQHQKRSEPCTGTDPPTHLPGSANQHCPRRASRACRWSLPPPGWALLCQGSTAAPCPLPHAHPECSKHSSTACAHGRQLPAGSQAERQGAAARVPGAMAGTAMSPAQAATAEPKPAGKGTGSRSCWPDLPREKQAWGGGQQAPAAGQPSHPGSGGGPWHSAGHRRAQALALQSGSTAILCSA